MNYRYHAILLVFITSFLFSSGSLAIDLDPIENNQYLINNLNSNLLERSSYESIIFNQSHHIPYGSFIFKDIDKFNTIDTLGMKTQFILRKGDYTFRDLMISTYKINSQNIHFRYMGLVRSYDPTTIPNLLGQNFLQNHILSIIKRTEKTHISSQISYFSEDPDVPISYYWDLNDISKSYYHTRESNSTIWGIRVKHTINDYMNLSYQNSNQYSNLMQYINDTGNLSSSYQDKYIDDIYYSNFQNIYIDYMYKKVLFFSSLSSIHDESVMSNYPTNDIQNTSLAVGFKMQLGNGQLEFSLLSKQIDIRSENTSIQYFSTTPSLLYLYQINEKSNISYTVGFIDGIYDEREYGESANTYDYLRGILRFANQELRYNLKLENHSLDIGAGKVDSISTYSINGNSNYSDSYTYFSIGYKYIKEYFHLNLESKKYLKFSNDSSSYSTWLDAYINYSLKFLYPIKNKQYTVYFEGRGKFLSINQGGIFVNEFPLICSKSANRCLSDDEELVYRHFIDLAFGIEFKNFILSYHNITNNGKDFSWDSPYSDIGNNFALPNYSFGDNEYSIFHYLKISWTFLD